MERKGPLDFVFNPRYEGASNQQEVVVSDYFVKRIIEGTNVRKWTDEAVRLGYLLEKGSLYSKERDGSYYRLKEGDVVPLPQMNPKEGKAGLKSKIVVDIPGEVSNNIQLRHKSDFYGWTRRAIGLRLRAENMSLFRKIGKDFERIVLSTQE